MLNDLESLPNDPDELRGMVTILAKEVKSQALFIEKLQHQLHGANRHRFGSTSETLDQLQLSLENEEIAVAAEVTDTPEPEVSEPKNKPKRKLSLSVYGLCNDRRATPIYAVSVSVRRTDRRDKLCLR